MALNQQPPTSINLSSVRWHVFYFHGSYYCSQYPPQSRVGRSRILASLFPFEHCTPLGRYPSATYAEQPHTSGARCFQAQRRNGLAKRPVFHSIAKPAPTSVQLEKQKGTLPNHGCLSEPSPWPLKTGTSRGACSPSPVIWCLSSQSLDRKSGCPRRASQCASSLFLALGRGNATCSQAASGVNFDSRPQSQVRFG